MDKIVTEHIWGELLREGTPGAHPIKVQLDITVKEKHLDDRTAPIGILQKVSLSPKSGVVEDGDDYILRYTFDGKQAEEKMRVQGGKLYARHAG
jgi:hypothetical protein